jgi:hypothetical protein
MASLSGTSINTTYPGLIKTTDNAAITGTLKALEDGAGNTLPIEVSSTGVNFTGTVTGLPGGAAGLEAGTGADSMQSADFLTSAQPANAEGGKSIAIGYQSRTGSGAGEATAVGWNTWANASQATAIGSGAGAYQSRAVAVGQSVDAGGFGSVAVGNSSQANGESGIVIGGYVSKANGDFSISMGRETNANFTDAIALGRFGVAGAAGAIAIGANSTSGFDSAVALGKDVTSTKANTVHVKALETQTPSTPTAGGIVMVDAGSTERRLNIDASGNLQIDSTPVGGGGGGTPSYSESWVTRGAYTGAEDIVYFNSSVYPIWLEEGMNLQTFSAYVGPTGAPAGMTMDFALFSSQRFATPNVSRMLVPHENLFQIGTSIPFTTPGEVEVTGLSYTVPHSGVYFVHYRSSDTGWWGGRAALALGDGNGNYQQINANNIFNQNAAVAGRYWVGEGSVPSSYSNSFSWNDAAPNMFFFFKYN